MSRLHGSIPVAGAVQLDMQHITRSALMRKWRLEYECHGAPYRWTGEAANESAADTVARHALAVEYATFNAAEAVLTSCVEA